MPMILWKHNGKFATMATTQVPLRPHRSCAHPKGELLFDAWIVGNAHLPQLTNQAKSSENLSPVSSSIKKFGGKMSSALKLNQKDSDKKKKGGGWFRGAISMLDLTNSKSNLAKKEPPTHEPSFFKSSTTSHTFPAPEVNGLSPKMADSSGGALVVIRGDYLGRDADDVLHVFICGVDMVSNLKYVSSSKLIVTLLPCTPCSGNVIVETKSGGLGSSTVEFSFVESSAAGFIFDAASMCSNTSSFSFNSRDSYQEKLVAPNQEKIGGFNQDKMSGSNQDRRYSSNLEKHTWSPSKDEEEEEGRRSVIQDLPIIEEDYEDISNMFPLTSNKTLHDHFNEEHGDRTSFTNKLNFYETNVNKTPRNSNSFDYNCTDAYQKKKNNDNKMSFIMIKSLANDNDKEIKKSSEINSISKPRHKLSSAIDNDKGWMEIEKKFSCTDVPHVTGDRKCNSESSITPNRGHIAHNNDEDKVTSFKSELKFKASPPHEVDKICTDHVSRQQLASQSHHQMSTQHAYQPQTTLSQHILSEQLHQHTQLQHSLDLQSPSRPPPPRIRRYRPTSELHLKTPEDRVDQKRRITASNITLDESSLAHGKNNFEKKVIEIQPLHRDQRVEMVNAPDVPLRTNHIRSRIEELSRDLDNNDASPHRSMNHIPQAFPHFHLISSNSKFNNLNQTNHIQTPTNSQQRTTNPPQITNNQPNHSHTKSTSSLHSTQDPVFSSTGSFRKKVQPNKKFIRALRDEDDVDNGRSNTPPFKPPRIKDILNFDDSGMKDNSDEVNKFSNDEHRTTESNTAIITATNFTNQHGLFELDRMFFIFFHLLMI